MHIYSFLDPISNEIRYIGKTRAKNSNYLNSIRRLKKLDSKWIQDLLKQNMVPIVEYIVEVEPREAKERIRNIQEHCRANGCNIIDDLSSKRIPTNKGMSVISHDELYQLYIREGLTIVQTSERLGVSSETVRKKLKDFKIRDSSNKSSHYSHDRTFFNIIDNEAKAYMLGFIAADGNVYKTPRGNNWQLTIELQVQDLSLLELFKEQLKYTGPIYTNSKEGRDYCMLKISLPELAFGLRNHNIVERKTNNIEWPKELPKDMIRHYLRGYYDGDGSIVVSKNKATLIMCCNRIEFLEELREHLTKQLELKAKVAIREDRGVNRLDYGAYPHVKGNAVSKILDYLYKDATVYLPRKLKKYLEVKQLEAVDVKSYKQKRQEQNGVGIKRVEDGRLYPSISEAARDVGSRVGNIRQALKNPHRTCKGFHWMYA